MKTAPVKDSNQIENSWQTKSKAKSSSASIKGMLRSQKGEKRGVYLRITINREQDYFSTGYYVFPKDFDSATGLVKGKEPNKESINSYIRNLTKELDDILYELKKSGELISLNNFRKFYSIRFQQNLSFEEFFNQELMGMKNIEASTVEVYKRLPKKLNEYKARLRLQDFDKALIEDWRSWLRTKDLCENTVCHYLETLRTFLIKAFDGNLIKENPFKYIKIPKIIGERDYLTEEELRAFMEVDIPVANTGEIRSRNMFVFCCLTGMRYSDLVGLRWEYVRIINNDLHFRMKKTKEFVTIPLTDRAKDIIKAQDRTHELVFRSISNQKFNEHLHTIEKRAGIQKNITVHVARHTFATLALERGIALEVVSKILGHKNIKMTMVYAKITQKKLQDEMKKLNGLAENLEVNTTASTDDVNNLIKQMRSIMMKMENLKLVG